MNVALALLAIIAGASVILARRTTISVIIRKDSTDMATIKERLAALEAAKDDAVSKADMSALADRVTAVEGEIGTDPAPANATVAIDPVTGLPIQ